jgi:hypothetical protein
MKQLIILIGAAAMALLALVAAIHALTPAPFDPVAYEQQRIAIQQAQAIAPAQFVSAFVLALMPAAIAVTCLVMLAAWGSVAIIRFRRERQPDARGLLPVNAWQLADVAPDALGAYHGARQIEAARQPVPHTITYSPSSAPHYAPRFDYRGGLGGAALSAADEPAARGDVPSFAELLSAGRIGRGQPLMLGYDLAEGAPIWGTWRDLYSAGVGGSQGGGKSWTAASLIAQSMLNGAQVILCDPHAGDDESLTTRLELLLPYMLMHADDDQQIEAAAHFAGDELARRREKKSSDRSPILLVIDEWTSLLRRGLSDKLPPILSDLTQEGRKYGVNALLLAQRWSVGAAGGGDVRNCLTAHYVHRTRADEARMQTGLRGSALPDDTMTLQPGQSYLVDTKGSVRKVATPTMQASDLGHVAGLLGKPDGSLMEAQTEQASRSSIRPEAARALSLFQNGLDVPQIVKELRGVDAQGGRRYQDAAREVQALLREALGA